MTTIAATMIEIIINTSVGCLELATASCSHFGSEFTTLLHTPSLKEPGVGRVLFDICCIALLGGIRLLCWDISTFQKPTSNVVGGLDQ
jgi:hypothetical protein